MRNLFITLSLSCFSLLSCAQDSSVCFQKSSCFPDALRPVLIQYNKRFRLGSNTADSIDFNKIVLTCAVGQKRANNDTLVKEVPEIKKSVVSPVKNTPAVSDSNDNSFNKVKTLEVINLGPVKQQVGTMSAAVTHISGEELKNLPSTDVATLLQGKVAGLEIITASGELGASAQITLRGPNSLNQGKPLFVIDGVVQPHDAGSLDAGNNINPNDIAAIDVLKDAAACAIYGAAAAGGVIVITTKSGKGVSGNPNAKVVLQDQEDVDYMEAIAVAPTGKKYEEYLSLESAFGDKMNFYLDMAMYFYQEGLAQPTSEMMKKASSICYDTLPGQTAIAFVYEYMKQYQEAIAVYKHLLDLYPDNLRLTRDLAWSYYEDHQWDKAVKTLYQAIAADAYPADVQTVQLKDIMLADMNMMIALNKQLLNIDYIPAEMIKPVAADLRVLIESNNNSLAGLSVKHGHHIINQFAPVEKNNARLLNSGDDYALTELQIKKADDRKITITTPFYNRGWFVQSPTFVRMIRIEDFGKPNQTMETDIAVLDDQYGQIELSAFTAKK